MPESKQCAECGREFGRPPRRSAKQWAQMQCCTSACANAQRARQHNPMHDPDVRGQHGVRVAAGMALSPHVLAARQRKAQQIEQRRVRMERRDLRLMLQQVDVVAYRIAKPCDCRACVLARAKQARTARRNEKKGLVLELKGRTCQACSGMFQPEYLHFHHLDPSTKRFELSRGTSWHYRADEIVAEARKCIVVCAGCHMAIHRGKPAPAGRQMRLI